MDRNNLIWVLECCMLCLDGCTKEQMLEFGASEQLAEMGINLCNYFKQKNLKLEVY